MKNPFRTNAIFGVDEHGNEFKNDEEREEWEQEQQREDDDRHARHGDGPLITGF